MTGFVHLTQSWVKTTQCILDQIIGALVSIRDLKMNGNVM